MKIRRVELEQIQRCACAGYPYEVCGVLLGDGPQRDRRVRRVQPMENRETESPRVRYQIAPEELISVQRAARDDGLEIIGFYHSHPDHPARPSETDRRVAAEGLSDGVIHMVIGVERGERAIPSAWIFRDEKQGFDEEPYEIE